MLYLLKFHIGRSKAITVKYFELTLKMDERKVRSICKHLSEDHGLAIASSVRKPAGIFLVETSEEYGEYLAQEEGRALSILRRVSRHRRTRLSEYLGQLRLEADRD